MSFGFVHLEAEDGSYTGTKKDRSAASGKATIHLTTSQHVTSQFSTLSSCLLTIHDVAYTNDGGSDTIEAYIDSIKIGSFDTIGASNYGLNWNVIRNTGRIGNNTKISSGAHELQFKAVNTDEYGVELDKSILNLTCPAEISSPKCTKISQLSSALTCKHRPYATQNSSNTGCAEEDNINIPIYYSGVQNFNVIARLPEYYPSITTMNNRKANFTNCAFVSQIIWEIGMKDDSHSEFSASCPSHVYSIGEPTSAFCFEVNENNKKYKIHFAAKGITTGSVEASIGSALTVKFTKVTGSLVLEVRCFGRGKKWLSVGIAKFSSFELTKTWQVPDLTWIEGENQIELLVANESSINASGTFDYLKLEKRKENGESSPITVFNDGETIIEAIIIDFWWLYPKGMTIKSLNNNQQWHNITYFRIYAKIPGTNNFSQLFVLYQDGNSRILPFPPSGIDWIPFGSSVIIGPAVNPLRPYASIIRVNINPSRLTMELHYESGGKATATLQYTVTATTINIDDISYTSTPLIPFTTFRSMWVADGIADVDHIQTSGNSWRVQYGWQSISASTVRFFRSCVSTHNTLSPDITIVVQCKTNQASQSSASNKSNAFIWTVFAISFLFN